MNLPYFKARLITYRERIAIFSMYPDVPEAIELLKFNQKAAYRCQEMIKRLEMYLFNNVKGIL